MDYLPIFLAIRDKSCVVIGGGEVAVRKVALLRQAGAKVSIIAPKLAAALAQQVAEASVRHRSGEFVPADLDGATLVIAATNSATVNSAVALAANERRIPVNVVDTPDLCSFIMPAIIDRSPLVLAISSGGAAPVLARQLRSSVASN